MSVYESGSVALESFDDLIRPQQQPRRDRQPEGFAVLRLISSSNLVGCSKDGRPDERDVGPQLTTMVKCCADAPEDATSQAGEAGDRTRRHRNGAAC